MTETHLAPLMVQLILKVVQCKIGGCWLDKVDFHFFQAITAAADMKLLGHELWASFGSKTAEDHQNFGIYTKPNVGKYVIFFNFWKITNFIKFGTSYLVNHSSHRLIFIHFGNEKTSPTNHLEVMNPQKMMLPPYFGALKIGVFQY